MSERSELTIDPSHERGGPAAALPVLPLDSGAVLPGMVVTVAIESDEARGALQAADDDRLLLVPRVGGRYSTVGTVAQIEDRGKLPNGTPALVVRAQHRARIGAGILGTGDALWVEAEPVTDEPTTERAVVLAREYRAAARVLLDRVGGRGLTGLLREADDPGSLADTLGWWPELSAERKIELLETIDVEARIDKALTWLKESLAELELADQIRHDVSEGMERQQREFLLRQQLDAIRRELGEGDGEGDLAQTYRSRIVDAEIPSEVRDAIEREIDRLERTSPQNTEHAWMRTWLDTITELPWGVRSDDHLDLVDAQRVLDEDHTGLDEVKDRIVELLAIRKLREERGMGADTDRHAGTVLALVGPPGVGKTSLGESVARALGRSFARVALGGIRDEAEIRGHRRTYVGAMPGRIVRALSEAGTMNPVFLLDEIDKVGSDWRGDPSSALLEVLDPAQNHRFRDHYLEVDLDLSDVLFVATANVLDTIPAPLLDRMEIITVDGYTDDEKVAIARHHLVARQLERNGLRPDEVSLTDDALRALAERYTREAGVRGLERQLGKALRKVATRVAAGDPTPVAVDVDDLRELLGRPRFTRDEANRRAVPGVVNGLAVTGAGGDVLLVEATSMAGEPGLTLTGQLGDVMTESGQIALSYIRSRRDELGIDPAALERRLHVHFPAGAVPKDGPSAGITMTTALVGLLTGRPARTEVGMTGEVTLHGRVLPIGGLKQKLLAAHRAGLTDVIVPARNEPDLDDVPEQVRTELRIHLVTEVDEVLQLALASPDEPGEALSATQVPGAPAARPVEE